MVTSSADAPRQPWWRRGRSLALVGGLAAVAVVLAVVLTDRAATTPAPAAQNVALQSSSDPGPAPFTPTVARSTQPTASPTASSATPTNGSSGTGVVHNGGEVGLYGGTEQLSSCDVAQLTTYLTENPAKEQAWAAVEGIQPSAVPAYISSLTPVVLNVDTRVTNHGFAAGSATSFQSVLQSGTAVLIDSRGLPRVRCACGNPLLAPQADNSATRFTGTRWSGFQPGTVVIVVPSVTVVKVVVLYDPVSGIWFGRPMGGHGGSDHRVPPPVTSPAPSSSTSGATSGSAALSPSTSPSTSTSGSTSGSPSHSHGPSPSPSSTSPSPSSSSPSPSRSSAVPSSPPASSSPHTSPALRVVTPPVQSSVVPPSQSIVNSVSAGAATQ